MPQASDIVFYGSANRPTDDASTTGGAIDQTARPLDSEFSAAARPEIVSTDAADTMNVTIEGRDAGGGNITETQALNGQTPVLFSNTFERIKKVRLASAAAGTVTVRQGTGGTVRHTLAAGEREGFRLFLNSISASGAAKSLYEKIFARNGHGTETLASASFTLTADPGSLYEIAVAGAVDDSETVANRTTAPSGEVFVDDGVQQSLPGDGNLAAGAAIGLWLNQDLAAGQVAGKESATVQLSGATA